MLRRLVVLVLALIRTAEESRREAVRRAYVLTFGWGDYITP
ncbi:hypothetical protein [Streptomyces flaveolus]